MMMTSALFHTTVACRGAGGAVANIFIMAEMQYAHINRDICPCYGLQRTYNAVQADSYMIALARPRQMKQITAHSPC